MHPSLRSPSRPQRPPIWFVTAATCRGVRDGLDAARDRAFVKDAGFEPKPGRHLVLPAGGDWRRAVRHREAPTAAKTRSCPACCRACCPPAPTASPMRRTTRGSPRWPSRSAPTVSRATARRKDKAVQLVLPDGVDGAELSRIAEGVTLARDLINTPANDMGPAELEAAARALAKRHGAKFRVDRRRRSAEAELPADPRGRPRRRRSARRG